MIKPYFYTLKNDLRIIVINFPHLKSTEITLTVKSGKIYENPKDIGISHFTEHMLFRGTKKYPSGEILKTETNKIGAYLKGTTSGETVKFTIRTLNQHLEKGLEIIFEVSQMALIRKKDIILEQNTVLEEIKRSLDNLDRVVIYHLLPKTIFKNTMLTSLGLGEEKTIKNFDREKLLNFYKNFYIPSNMIIGINTSLPKEKIIKFVEKYFGDIKQGREKYSQGTLPRLKNEKVIFEKRSTHQLHIGLGIETFKFNHPQRYALEILRNIIRLNLYKALRSKSGLVYSIYSKTSFLSTTGFLSIKTATDKNNTTLILNNILNTLKLIKKSIKTEDFNNSKTLLKTNLIFEEEIPSDYLKQITYQKLYSDKIESTEDKINKIDQVKKEDVIKIANIFLNKRNMGFVFVGNIDLKFKKKVLKKIKNYNI